MVIVRISTRWLLHVLLFSCAPLLACLLHRSLQRALSWVGYGLNRLAVGPRDVLIDMVYAENLVRSSNQSLTNVHSSERQTEICLFAFCRLRTRMPPECSILFTTDCSSWARPFRHKAVYRVIVANVVVVLSVVANRGPF